MSEKILLSKYQALGNDYLFLNSLEYDFPSNEFTKQICHRNFGIGSDGILYGGCRDGRFEVTIINPDASIAEISGNGVRIFACAMYDLGYMKIGDEFNISTQFKTVNCKVVAENKFSVNMGVPVFSGKNIPDFEPNGRKIAVNGRSYVYYPVSMGNPHCVIFVNGINHENVLTDGPILENNPEFCEKTNVQFVRVIDDKNIEIEIWERGAGYTLASGSSSCAVFAAARKLNKCDSFIQMHMPGGDLDLQETSSNEIVQTGPVVKIADCWVKIP